MRRPEPHLAAEDAARNVLSCRANRPRTVSSSASAAVPAKWKDRPHLSFPCNAPDSSRRGTDRARGRPRATRASVASPS